VAAAETTEAQLSSLMVGRDVELGTRVPPLRAPGPALATVDKLCARNDRGRPAVREVSFELRAGEILAIAGVDGNGQTELAECLTGLRAPDSGAIRVGDQQLAGSSPRRFREAGVAHVPADRQQRGLCLDMRVDENLALGRQERPPFARGLLIDRHGRAEAAQRLCAELDVRPADPSLPARALSGGNQQKVILARELDERPKILLAVQPTRGLDIGAIATVHERLRRARDAGGGVLLFSLDLDEVLALADRILVLYGGRVMGVMAGEGADERALGRLMLGQSATPEASHG
jgi:simple sugar transport system ATP-binding protein